MQPSDSHGEIARRLAGALATLARTRYASVEHWKASRDTVQHGGNGPDWLKCQAALDLRRSLTISSHVIFLKGGMAPGGPYFMPGLNEVYEKKTPK